MIKPTHSIFDADPEFDGAGAKRLNVFLTSSIIFIILLLISFDINLREFKRMGVLDFAALLLMTAMPFICALLVYKRKKAGWIISFLFYAFVVLMTGMSTLQDLVKSHSNIDHYPSTRILAVLLAASFMMVSLFLPEFRRLLRINDKTFLRTAIVVTIVDVALVAVLYSLSM